MPALDKNTNLYAAVERVAAICKANRINLTAEAMAAAIVETVLNDCIDLAGAANKAATEKGESFDAASWAMEDGQKAVRKQMASNISKCITASKNFQNSYAHPSGLMDKAVSDSASVEFV